MQKAHRNIDWQNYPSVSTPVNQQNLNAMDVAIDTIDNRVITLDTTKLSAVDAQLLVKNIELNETTGVITITFLNNSQRTIQTALSKVPDRLDYDPEAQELIIIHIDGTRTSVDLGEIITQREFSDSDTVAFMVSESEVVCEQESMQIEGNEEREFMLPNSPFVDKIKIDSIVSQSGSAINFAISVDGATVYTTKRNYALLRFPQTVNLERIHFENLSSNSITLTGIQFLQVKQEGEKTVRSSEILEDFSNGSAAFVQFHSEIEYVNAFHVPYVGALGTANLTIEYDGQSFAVARNGLEIDFKDDVQEASVYIINNGARINAITVQYLYKERNNAPIGAVTAIVKENSIDGRHLRRDYLADITIEAGRAEASQAAALLSEQGAQASATTAEGFRNAAEASATAAGVSEQNARGSAEAAAGSASTAEQKAGEAASSETAARESASSAALSAQSAQEAAGETARDLENVQQLIQNTQADADSASESATAAESFAHGGTGTRIGEDTDNAQYYYQQSREIYDDFEAFDAVNKSNVLTTVEQVQAVTDPGKLADALVVKQVFQNVDDGKRLIANAITDKGVETLEDRTFATMASKIGELDDKIFEWRLKYENPNPMFYMYKELPLIYPASAVRGTRTLRYETEYMPKSYDWTLYYGTIMENENENVFLSITLTTEQGTTYIANRLNGTSGLQTFTTTLPRGWAHLEINFISETDTPTHPCTAYIYLYNVNEKCNAPTNIPFGNANTGDVLQGKTFSKAGVVGQKGSMPNKGAWIGTVAANSQIVIPSGYHNGSGYVQCTDAGYNAGVSATKVGTATAANVLSGKTFTNSSSVGASGTMTNQGAWTGNTTGSGNVTIPAGYHNGSGYVSGSGAYNKGVSDTKVGTATAANVLSGKTFTNSSSVGASGSMANYSGTSVTSANYSSYNSFVDFFVPYQGYYSTNSAVRVYRENIPTETKVIVDNYKISPSSSVQFTLAPGYKMIIVFQYAKSSDTSSGFTPRSLAINMYIGNFRLFNANDKNFFTIGSDGGSWSTTISLPFNWSSLSSSYMLLISELKNDSITINTRINGDIKYFTILELH